MDPNKTQSVLPALGNGQADSNMLASAKMSGGEYLSQNSGQPQMSPQKQMIINNVQKSLENLQMPVTQDNVQHVINGVSQGIPMDPRALISKKRDSLQQDLEDAVNSMKQDADFRNYMEQVQTGRKKETLLSQFTPYGQHRYDEKAAEANIDPALAAIYGTKNAIYQSRIAGIQSQMTFLDSAQNKLLLGSGLTNDQDYQDLIKALITGQNLPTSVDRATVDINQQKAALDVMKEQNRVSEKSTDISIAAGHLDVDKDRLKLDAAKAINDIGNSQINSQKTVAEIGKIGADTKKTLAELANPKVDLGELETKMNDNVMTLNAVTDIAKNLDTYDFTLANEVHDAYMKVKNKLGTAFDEKTWDQNLTPAEQKKLSANRVQQERIMQGMLARKKELAGTRWGEEIAKIIDKSFLTYGASPIEAQGSIRNLILTSMRDQVVVSRMAENKRNGIPNDKAQQDRIIVPADDPTIVEEAKARFPALFKDLTVDPFASYLNKQTGTYSLDAKAQAKLPPGVNLPDNMTRKEIEYIKENYPQLLTGV